MKQIDLTKQPKNPFLVPDDYFNGLSAKIMEQLPDQEATETCVFNPTETKDDVKVARRRKIWIRGISRIGIAASVCGLVFGVTLYQKQHAEEINALATLNTVQVYVSSENYESFDDACEYAMISTNDVFAFATGNE